MRMSKYIPHREHSPITDWRKPNFALWVVFILYQHQNCQQHHLPRPVCSLPVVAKASFQLTHAVAATAVSKGVFQVICWCNYCCHFCFFSSCCRSCPSELGACLLLHHCCGTTITTNKSSAAHAHAQVQLPTTENLVFICNKHPVQC